MKRFEKILIEAEEGTRLEVSKVANGELFIKVKKNITTNDYSENYVRPPIPSGYKHLLGKWSNGFVIERISDRSQFVWIPVGYLDSNGTLDGISFTEKFGRRNYHGDEFSEFQYHETLTDELNSQIKSIKKYGGFYISRYHISKNEETGKPQSTKGIMPLVNIGFEDAKSIASSFEDKDSIKSHLTYGSEYDSISEWLIKSNAVSYDKMPDPYEKIHETGSNEEWYFNNICDFLVNVNEWTQEQNNKSYRVIRTKKNRINFLAYNGYLRNFANTTYNACDTGFRASLYLK